MLQNAFVDAKVSPSAVIVIEILSLCAFVVRQADRACSSRLSTVLDCQPLAFASSSKRRVRGLMIRCSRWKGQQTSECRWRKVKDFHAALFSRIVGSFALLFINDGRLTKKKRLKQLFGCVWLRHPHVRTNAQTSSLHTRRHTKLA